MMAEVFDRDEREDGPLSRVEAGYICFPASDLEVRFNESGDRASFPLRLPPTARLPLTSLGSLGGPPLSPPSMVSLT